MISLCLLIRDVPNLTDLVNMFKRNCPCKYEICIGDNSSSNKYAAEAINLADVYLTISDKEQWRKGNPWGHERIAALANSYKIFYIDSDEYPVWIHPNIEDMYDTSYIPTTYRIDFLTMEDIMKIDKEIDNNAEKPPEIHIDNPIEWQGHQDRLYHARYVKFNGPCHASFHAPKHFFSNTPATLLLHNKTVRDQKDLDRMRTIIREQYARQNINPALAGSEAVLKWGQEPGKRYTHKFKDYKDFKENYNGYPYDF